MPTTDEQRAEFPPLTPIQIRLGLLTIGINEVAVEEALYGDDEGLTNWRYRHSYERLHPLVKSLSAFFGLTDEQVDDLWLSSANL